MVQCGVVLARKPKHTIFTNAGVQFVFVRGLVSGVCYAQKCWPIPLSAQCGLTFVVLRQKKVLGITLKSRNKISIRVSSQNLETLSQHFI
jgi:hypothetical protein